ncbi:MAG TPA: glycine C-acetyltransferase [Candidatus Polarisedimenticolia bacterium]|nr:glycine C-acetyltransferase [Candidatus Polarisedimenticolia bacterium]
MAGKLDFIAQEMAALKEQGLLINVPVIDSPQGAWITVNGKKVLNLCSNNYLGLANHEVLKRRAQKAIEAFGVGPAAVRTIAGTLTLHRELEAKLARFKGVEAALTFQSGFCANLAALGSLAGPEDLICSDELNHASIIDGSRLSRAKVVRYTHADPQDLRDKLRSETGARRRLVITDGVFSMDGDIAPLREIVAVAAEHDALTLVDDAHGEGVLGRSGRGIVDHFQLHGQVDLEIGTLSKAFGVVGGVVAGSRALADYIQQKGRPLLFSSAMTPADAAACLAGVELLERSGELVERLWANTRHFKEAMRGLGYDLGRSETPITPVMIGEAKLAGAFSRKLFEEGIFAMSIGYPTVARDKARIRVMISATHSDKDLDFALDVFGRVGRELAIL